MDELRARFVFSHPLSAQKPLPFGKLLWGEEIAFSQGKIRTLLIHLGQWHPMISHQFSPTHRHLSRRCYVSGAMLGDLGGASSSLWASVFPSAKWP